MPASSRILLVDDEISLGKTVGKQLAMQYGANAYIAYIRKPFRAEELFGTIRKLLTPSS